MYPMSACRTQAGGRSAGGILLPQNLILTSTLLEGFENAADWNPLVACNVATDTDHMEGTYAIKVTPTSATTVKMDKTISWVSDGHIRLHWKAVVAARQPVWSFSSVTNWSKYMEYQPGSTLKHIGWNTLDTQPANWTATGGESWANTMIRMRISLLVGATSETYSYDGLLGGVTSTPAILFAFDDGLSSIYSQAYPILAAKHIKATLYMISDQIGGGGYVTAANLQTLDAAGWDIGNHTKAHADLNTRTEAQQESDLSACKAALDALGLTRASMHVAYPHGLWDDNVLISMPATGMLTGRTVDYAHFDVLPVADPYALSAYNLDSSHSLAQAKAKVDSIKTNGQILIFFTHHLGSADATGWATQDYSDLVDYVVAQGVQPLTITEFQSLRSGPITVTAPY
jgi:peptidoglycan/xylan/chitin deacetylase (PgdA/CDA1 family)